MITAFYRTAASAFSLLALSAMFGCGGTGGTDAAASSTAAPAANVEAPAPSAAASNSAPTISGKAGATAVAGKLYSFQPVAADADSDPLTFSASNLPAWAVFNASTGALRGTPAAGDVRTYSNIVISVSDGKSTTPLTAFTINVTATGGGGSVTLSWSPPTQNVDGSVLSDLAGYKLLYGPSQNELSQTVAISNPSLNSYVLSDLSSGTWYFALVALNKAGEESDPSNVVSKAIS
jgi:hypothetical protein